MLCCSDNDITVKALNSSETLCCLSLKIFHLDIIQQVLVQSLEYKNSAYGQQFNTIFSVFMHCTSPIPSLRISKITCTQVWLTHPLTLPWVTNTNFSHWNTLDTDTCQEYQCISNTKYMTRLIQCAHHIAMALIQFYFCKKVSRVLYEKLFQSDNTQRN